MRLILILLLRHCPRLQDFPAYWTGFRLRSVMETVLLSELPPETVARVADLEVYSEDATRLKAMGICVGRQVQLMRAGDPLILRVLGARVGLSARLAAGVSVTPID